MNNTLYDLFLYLEVTIDEELTSIFKSEGKGTEKVQKEKLNWLLENDEIQLVWSMINILGLGPERNCLSVHYRLAWSRRSTRKQKLPPQREAFFMYKELKRQDAASDKTE